MNLERQVKATQFRKEGTLQRAICILIFVLLSCHSWKGIYKSNLKSHTNLLGSPRNLSERRDSTGQSQLLVRMELKSITARLCCREDSQTPRLTTQLCPIPMSIRTVCTCSHRALSYVLTRKNLTIGSPAKYSRAGP